MPEQWHALRIFFGDLRLQGSYSLTEWLAADLMGSLRVVRIGFELQDLDRRPIAQPYGEELHHRDETLVGLSDLWLALRFSGELQGLGLTARLGATLPVGTTVENPFRLGREGRAHQHIQFGTGTVDPFAEVLLQREIGRFALSGWLLARLPLYENQHGYRAGTLLSGGIRAASDLWLRRWHFLLGALVYHEQPERWSGVIETEGNLGRTDLMLEAVATWRFAGPWALSVGARFPLHSWIVGAQLNTPALVDLTIARPFQLGR